DEDIVHMNWEHSARLCRRSLKSFHSVSSFLALAHQIPKSIPVYIESHLGKGVRGEDVAKEIHALGFEEIRLTTGFTAEDFPPMPWIKEVVGKEPPWHVPASSQGGDAP